MNSIKPSSGERETLAHDTGTGPQAHGKQHGSFNFHMSSGFLRAQLKDLCSINRLVVKHGYRRRMKNLLCSANIQTLWFQDVCSDLRFRPLKLSPLAVTTLNCNRQLKGWIIKQWHCDLTLFHARSLGSRNHTYSSKYFYSSGPSFYRQLVWGRETALENQSSKHFWEWIKLHFASVI